MATVGVISSVSMIYFISTGIRPDANYIIVMALFEVIIIVSVFSNFGQTIYDESIKLNDVLYKCPWIYWNNKNRKMLIIMLISTKPLEVSCYKLVTLDHQILKKVSLNFS
uniref:Uncharacterized protein LOC114345567 n=1 Tax=Diabrotica virgifera virgifera TaxID=50390 RepID=A0A6P7GRL0_DIAVI